MRKVYSNSEKAEFVSLYAAGNSLKSIENMKGIPATTLRMMLLGSGVAMRKPGARAVYKVSNDEVRRLRNEGFTYAEIADKLGVSYYKVGRILRSKCKGRPRKFSVSQMAEISLHHRNGQSIPQLSERYNCSHSTVSAAIRTMEAV